jgi:hypothetical protein
MSDVALDHTVPLEQPAGLPADLLADLLADLPQRDLNELAS